VAWAVEALGWGGWPDRLDVAMGLRHLPGEGVMPALLGAVEHDPEYLVRYHAAESLLHLGRIDPSDITAHPEVFADLAAGADREPTAEDKQRHARAAAALRGLLGR
jgi:HEAT repeat protein